MSDDLLKIVRNVRRLAALECAGLLDTPPEASFDRLTSLASRVVHAPVALISLVDRDRQFFKSFVGLAERWAARRETPLSHSFCKHVVATGEPLVVEDARKHVVLRDNPAVQEMGAVAYAGVPLTSSDGQALGSFCVIDHQPRTWAYDDVLVLRDLAACAMREIELRMVAREADRARSVAEARVRELEARLGDS
jgi:GAF domain-containing protein